jgi:steroid delta-isomerase-like uncharacterized protein
MGPSDTDIKAIVRRMNDEVWGEENLDLITTYVAEEYVETTNATPDPIHGPDGYRDIVERFHRAFSDVTVTTEQLVAEGDTVVNRWRFDVTHTGPYMGIEATGKDAHLSGISIIDFEDGMIVEDHAVVDISGFMQQLGVSR